MKIKDTLVDYTVIPNIPVKHLSNEIEDLTQNFKNALKAHIEKPWETIKRYKGYFHDINSCFIKCVLNKEKSKSGIYVHQRNGYSIDIAIKELFGFMVSQKNMHMKYSIDKLYKLVLVEVSILSLTYGEVYDFQIRFAIIKLLTTRFSFYTQCIDDSWSIHIFYDGQDDIETVYNMVLDTDISQLPGINNELVNLKTLKHDRLTAKDIMKPRCLEDLTCLFDEGTSQTHKKEIIARHYKTSMSTAQRWMKKYGLLNKSFREIHEERSAREHEEIKTLVINQHAVTYEAISDNAQIIIDRLTAKIDELTAMVGAQTDELSMLKHEIKQLREENTSLRRNQFSGMISKQDCDLFDTDLENMGICCKRVGFSNRSDSSYIPGI